MPNKNCNGCYTRLLFCVPNGFQTTSRSNSCEQRFDHQSRKTTSNQGLKTDCFLRSDVLFRFEKL